MADGSTLPPLRIARPKPRRELLSSRSPHDAHLMNVEQTAEDHTELFEEGGWFTISSEGRSVDLNSQTARHVAEAILRAQGRA